MKKLMVFVAAVAVSASSATMAATVSDLSGKVLVNKGEGFVAAVAGETLEVGDRVLVGEKSFATLNYNECAVAISKPTVMTVVEQPVCSVVISPVADAVYPSDSADYSAAGLGVPPAILLLGAGAAAVGVAAAAGAFDTKSNNNAPVSAPGIFR